MLSKIRLIGHTISYLKPIQVYWRFWLRLYKPKINLSLPPQQRQPVQPLFSLPKKNSSLTSPATFTFLNETHLLQSVSDWNHPQREKLWLYNLHYFDDLNASDADDKQHDHQILIRKWIVENPPASGNGWEPYPLSLRIVNWIKWAKQGNSLEPDWQHSLAVQVRRLRHQLEYHLLGNHLFANAKALVIAGLFFEGDEASSWLKKGLDILDQELPEQILDDGGHFELSPMYHLIILEDILDLIHFSHCYKDVIPSDTVSYWSDLVSKMLNWLQFMTHPDEDIALFNDAAFGIAAKPIALMNYAAKFNINTSLAVTSSQLLSSSGYARLENDSAVLIADVGKIGPDYLPGHAHADTLSFELSLFKQRVIVDSGTSCYGHSDERLRQRSTHAHNTIEVDGESSSEVWGGFRVARRAYPLNIHFDASKENIKLSASHNGYHRLHKNIYHQRQWQVKNKAIIVEDHVNGSIKKATGRFLFSPDVNIVKGDNDNQWFITLLQGQTVTLNLMNTQSELVDSTYHPEFGRAVKTKCLVYVVKSHTHVITSFNW